MDQAAIPATIANLARLTANRIKADSRENPLEPGQWIEPPEIGSKRLGRDQDADLNDVPDQGGQHHGQATRLTYSARSTAECDACDWRRRNRNRGLVRPSAAYRPSSRQAMPHRGTART